MAVAAVLDGEGGGYLVAVAADDFGEGPEVFLFFGGDPAFDDDVVGVLDFFVGFHVSFLSGLVFGV